MIYSDWVTTNTGIFYQLNRAKPLPFTSDTMTVANIDQEFLLENGNKELYIDDTTILVNSILGAYYHRWQDLATFFSSIEDGTSSEIISTSNNNQENQNKIALNDSTDMFVAGGLNSNGSAQTSTKTKNYTEFGNFILSNDFYGIIKREIRTYIFINVY